MPFVKSSKRKPTPLKATPANIVKVGIQESIARRRRLLSILGQNGADIARFQQATLDQFLIRLGVPMDRLKNTTMAEAETYAEYWAEKNRPTPTSAGVAEKKAPAGLPAGDWLMPPVTLSTFEKRLGMNVDKVRSLLKQYGLQNFPEVNRQSWTVNMQGMPEALRNKVQGKKLP